MVTITAAPWYWFTRRTALTVFFVFSFVVGVGTGIITAYWTWRPSDFTTAVERECRHAGNPRYHDTCQNRLDDAYSVWEERHYR